ncbi:hypothetical protein ACLF3G_08070 [Falsiroseomonas sp. HC035]|uniref:hypothetical protein n=1 Tax=Falsiroseomonas sp. HC035 TaxID=3390999 RepID=UPI003D30FF11
MNVSQTPVDWHVHAHQAGDMAVVLDSAATAFARVNGAPVGVLMLAEMPGQQVFAELAEGTTAGWTMQATEEVASLVAARGDARIIIVAGHQVLTAERLEILAFGTRLRPRDGMPASTMLRDLAQQDVLAVLPWGVGKWLGHRGTVVEGLVKDLPPQTLALGDNAARPRLWPTPAAFQEAARRGIAVLPGTDTLPGAAPAAGQFGSLVPGGISLRRPMAALRRAVERPATLKRYGTLAGPATFLRDQAMLRLRRIGGRRS